MGVRVGSAFVAVLVLIVSLAPFATGAPDAPVPAQPIVLAVGGLDEMATRNVYAPLAWQHARTMAVLARVYDTPVQRDPATGAIVPRLAVGIDQDGDDRLDPAEAGDFTVALGAVNVTVFYDLGSARFHGGAPVTAMDLLFSYHAWALHPVAGGPLRVLMDRGGDAGSNFTVDRWLGLREVDDGDGNASTAALGFTRSYDFVNFAWATLGIPVFPRHLWEGTGGGRHADFGLAVYPEGHPRVGQGVPTWETTYRPFDAFGAAGWAMADADVVGSGHFRLESVVWGVETRLAANPDYAFGPPKIDGIRFKVYRTTQLLILALKAGEIDLVFGNVPPEFFQDLQDPDLSLLETEDLFPAALLFNLRRVPWGYGTYPPANRSADVGQILRRAIAELTDRQTMVDALLSGHGAVAHAMVAPWNDGWYNASVPKYPFNMTDAEALLDSPEARAAGIGPDPAGPCSRDTPSGCRPLSALGTVPFEILTPQADYDPILASGGAMIASAMRQVGLNALSRPTAYGAILTALMVRSFDLALLMRPEIHAADAWTLGLGDPDYLWDLFHSSNGAAGSSYEGFWDAEFDGAADASRLAGDFMPRDWHVHRAQGVLAERLPAVPLYYRNWTWAWRSDRFTGYVLAATTVFNYWTLQGLEPVANPPPRILLRSPPDGSVIAPGTVIDLDVVDDDLRSVWYSRDGGITITLPAPYDIDTSGWPDGPHAVEVSALDAVGNLATETYRFTMDGTPPAIALLSPPDGAVVPAGTVLDFDVQDANLDDVQVTIDGGAPTLLPAPFDVPLDGFAEGPHTIDMEARDLAGNVATSSHSVFLDATAPAIVLLSPADGAVVPAGAVLDFDVQDVHLASVRIAVDGDAPEPLPAPFDRSLDGLPDGTHTFAVVATDAAGNAATASYSVTLDATAPSIALLSPANGSKLPRNGVASFAISDAHLAEVSVSVDGGAPVALPAPYALSFRALNDTLGFGPGTHAITVRATDTVGNAALRMYTFDWDPVAPAVVGAEPRGEAVGTAAEVRVTFSEAVDRTSAEAAFSLTDGARRWTASNGTVAWSPDGRSFTFVPDGGFASDRAYEVRLAGTLTDEAGNPMGDDVAWTFRTAPIGVPVAGGPWLWVAVILAAVLLVLVLIFWRRRRRKGARQDVVPSEAAAGVAAADESGR